MKYTFMGNSMEVYNLLEKVRSNAYNIDFISNSYKSFVEDGKLFFAGAYLNEELVAGCFMSNKYDSIFIEELFVAKKYQNKGLGIGSNLLKFILDNKEELEIYYDKKFDYTKLEAASKSLEEFYEKLGYHTQDSFINMVKRI